jgi:hypothetical protein
LAVSRQNQGGSNSKLPSRSTQLDQVEAREVAQRKKDRAFMVTSLGGPNLALAKLHDLI